MNETEKNHQTLQDKNNGSLARTKRNSDLQRAQLITFSKFKSDPAAGSKNETCKNSTELTKVILTRLRFIKAVQIIPFPKAETKSYFIVQMIVIGMHVHHKQYLV